LKGYPVAVAVPALARDTAVAARLWKEAERLTDSVFSL